MSGIDLVFRTAIGYERTHQVALYALLEESKEFVFSLLGIPGAEEVSWEPERRLFDLSVKNAERSVYIELKVGSRLGKGQVKRQSKFLEESGQKGRYVLLGTSWFEFDERKIEERTGGTSKRIGYDELTDALNSLLVAPGLSSEVYELALSYRKALQDQFRELKDAARKSDKDTQQFYYSLYWMLQSRLDGLSTAIYTVNNQGGSVYILKDEKWYEFSADGVIVHLYQEVVNARLCIKFRADTGDVHLKRRVRSMVREATHAILGSRCDLVDKGRVGVYMTACQVNHNFADVNSLDQSAQVFRDVHTALPRIEQRLSAGCS